MQELSLDGRPLQAQPKPQAPDRRTHCCTPANAQLRLFAPFLRSSALPRVTPGARVPRRQSSLRRVCRLATGAASPLVPRVLCLETRVDPARRATLAGLHAPQFIGGEGHQAPRTRKQPAPCLLTPFALLSSVAPACATPLLRPADPLVLVTTRGSCTLRAPTIPSSTCS